MDVVIKFNKSAFKHGISEADIRHAYRNKIADRLVNELPEKYALVGFDENWNPVEIMYNPVDDCTINVFHAMKARDSFIKELGL
ncbi:hypothetical protein AGMMS50293_25450 [Spirochaetia bacterium]|nr:hypothetical protein AGMMS50293_25450 [Spirochaetia bacterium]